MKGELVESRIVVWDVSASQKLFGEGYYGKPIGISKPKHDEIDAPLILDLIEGLYLTEESRITIHRSKRRIPHDELLAICRAEYHNFDKKYQVYKNFRDLGYIVTPGIKFGCDFAVYERGPGIDHAPYLVQVYSRRDPITSTAVVLAGRLATTVRKHFILAIPQARGRVSYIALDWWKA